MERRETDAYEARLWSRRFAVETAKRYRIETMVARSFTEQEWKRESWMWWVNEIISRNTLNPIIRGEKVKWTRNVIGNAKTKKRSAWILERRKVMGERYWHGIG